MATYSKGNSKNYPILSPVEMEAAQRNPTHSCRAANRSVFPGLVVDPGSIVHAHASTACNLTPCTRNTKSDMASRVGAGRTSTLSAQCSRPRGKWMQPKACNTAQVMPLITTPITIAAPLQHHRRAERVRPLHFHVKLLHGTAPQRDVNPCYLLWRARSTYVLLRTRDANPNN